MWSHSLSGHQQQHTAVAGGLSTAAQWACCVRQRAAAQHRAHLRTAPAPCAPPHPAARPAAPPCTLHSPVRSSSRHTHQQQQVSAWVAKVAQSRGLGGPTTSMTASSTRPARGEHALAIQLTADVGCDGRRNLVDAISGRGGQARWPWGAARAPPCAAPRPCHHAAVPGSSITHSVSSRSTRMWLKVRLYVGSSTPS